MAQTLRPRGLIELSEFDFRVYDVDKTPILPSRLEEETPWLARWMNMVNVAVQQRGGEPDAANHLERWVRDQPLLEEQVYREIWFQTGPWKEGHDAQTARENRIGAMMRDDILVRLRFKHIKHMRYTHAVSVGFLEVWKAAPSQQRTRRLHGRRARKQCRARAPHSRRTNLHSRPKLVRETKS